MEKKLIEEVLSEIESDDLGYWLENYVDEDFTCENKKLEKLIKKAKKPFIELSEYVDQLLIKRDGE